MESQDKKESTPDLITRCVVKSKVHEAEIRVIRFNPNKDFATIHGISLARYLQNGIYFDKAFNEVNQGSKEPESPPVPPVVQTKSVAKAVPTKPENMPLKPKTEPAVSLKTPKNQVKTVSKRIGR